MSRIIPFTGRSITFVSELTELADMVGDVHLPKSTLSLEEDVSIISPVSRIAAYNQQFSVSLKLSAESIQIVSLSTQEILECPALLKDILHISEVEDVNASNTHSFENEFYIRFSEKVSAFNQVRGRSTTTISTIYLASPKREVILQAIRSAKAKWKAAKPENVAGADRRQIGPGDVPGTLLNIVLLNLSSDDANLRVSAYNLLCSVDSSFHFALHHSLHTAEGLIFYDN